MKNFFLVLALLLTLVASADEFRQGEREGILERRLNISEKIKIQEHRYEEPDAEEPISRSILPDYMPAIHTVYFSGPLSLELEDGSIWSIASSDRYLTEEWLSTDMVLIRPNTFFSVYDYQLWNVNLGIKVRANLNIGPFIGGFYTNYIIDIDYHYGKVYMLDGTVWNVSFFDKEILACWIIGDPIIFGVRDSILNPYILINANTDSYIRAS